jgi:hypothetical protein
MELTKEFLERLIPFLFLEKEVLDKFINGLTNINTNISIEKLSKSLKDLYPKELNNLDLDYLINSTLIMNRVKETSDLNSNEFIEKILTSIKKDIKKDLIEDLDFDFLKVKFSELIKISSINRISVAKQAFFDFQNLVYDTGIQTDIRPIYDETKNSINGFVITQNIKVQYNAEDRIRELYFALDRNDLIKLKDQIDLALKKEKLLVKDMKKTGVEFIDY